MHKIEKEAAKEKSDQTERNDAHQSPKQKTLLSIPDAAQLMILVLAVASVPAAFNYFSYSDSKSNLEESIRQLQNLQSDYFSRLQESSLSFSERIEERFSDLENDIENRIEKGEQRIENALGGDRGVRELDPSYLGTYLVGSVEYDKGDDKFFCYTGLYFMIDNRTENAVEVLSEEMRTRFPYGYGGFTTFFDGAWDVVYNDRQEWEERYFYGYSQRSKRYGFYISEEYLSVIMSELSLGNRGIEIEYRLTYRKEGPRTETKKIAINFEMPDELEQCLSSIPERRAGLISGDAPSGQPNP